MAERYQLGKGSPTASFNTYTVGNGRYMLLVCTYMHSQMHPCDMTPGKLNALSYVLCQGAQASVPKCLQRISSTLNLGA